MLDFDQHTAEDFAYLFGEELERLGLEDAFDVELDTRYEHEDPAMLELAEAYWTHLADDVLEVTEAQDNAEYECRTLYWVFTHAESTIEVTGDGTQIALRTGSFPQEILALIEQALAKNLDQ